MKRLTGGKKTYILAIFIIALVCLLFFYTYPFIGNFIAVKLGYTLENTQPFHNAKTDKYFYPDEITKIGKDQLIPFKCNYSTAIDCNLFNGRKLTIKEVDEKNLVHYTCKIVTNPVLGTTVGWACNSDSIFADPEKMGLVTTTDNFKPSFDVNETNQTKQFTMSGFTIQPQIAPIPNYLMAEKVIAITDSIVYFERSILYGYDLYKVDFKTGKVSKLDYIVKNEGDNPN